MSIYKRCLIFLVVGLLAMFSTTVQAGLIPVFEYSFPDSYDGTTQTVIDLSTAGNDATMRDLLLPGYVPDVRPPSFATGGSIYTAIGGSGMTDATKLLTNPVVAAHGGFTFDTWFMSDDSLTADGHLISNSGSDVLRVFDGKFQASMYAEDPPVNEHVYGPTIEADRWYHLAYRFDTMGNAVDAEGLILGELSLLVDNMVVGSAMMNRYPYTEILDRPIGFNGKGDQSGYWDVHPSSYLFNPSVSLGVVPEPSALVALAGLLGMLFVRRLIRR